MNQRKRIIVVGTGIRAIGMWIKAMLEQYKEEVEIAGIYDINPARAQACNKILNTNIPVFQSFNEMISSANPDAMVIASPDATHAEYVVRGIEAGLEVFCEKPLCTTLEQIHTIRTVAQQSSMPVTVTHNARFLPCAVQMKKEILAGRIGTPKHVIFSEMLDRFHGADYFRRWHRLMKNSGGLLLQKASHHFDLINWMITSQPQFVSAQGGLFFYGKNGKFRGKRCSECSHANECFFFADVFQNPYLRTLYKEVEHIDGYLRDQCVFGEDIDIYDTANLAISYKNNVTASYSLIAYASYEGMSFSIEGTEGRLEWKAQHNTSWAVGREKEENQKANLEQSGAHIGEQLIFYDPKHQAKDLTPPPKEGSHGGADPSILQFVFAASPPPDLLHQKASLEDGIQAVLLGIAANKSIENKGHTVDVQKCELI